MRFYDLYESTSYLLLETPQRAAWLVSNRGPNLLAKYEEEKKNGVIAAEISRQIDLMDGESTSEKLVKFIMSFDPTPAKNYSNWLCSRYMAKPSKGGCRLEDFNARVTADLALFERVSRSRRIENGNLDAYKSLQALEDVVEPFREGDREVSGRADRAAGRSTRETVMFPASDPMRSEDHVIALLDTPELLILQLKTEEAARHFGENTRWCTTSGMFNHYNSVSPLYVICDRKKNTRVQFHFNGANSQFMDERDDAINVNNYLKTYPSVLKVFRQQFLALLGVSIYGNGETISVDFFSNEELAQAPVPTLVRMIQKASDLDRFPNVLTEEGFKSIARRRPRANYDHWETRNHGKHIEEGQYRKILSKFFKALKPKFFLEFMMGEELNMWLWDYIPAKWKTDKVSDLLLERLFRWNTPNGLIQDIRKYFGDENSPTKTWTDKINTAFWDAGAVIGWSSENFPEEEFTDERMIRVLGANPNEISKFTDRLNSNIVASIIQDTTSEDIQKTFEHLPSEYKNKEAAKALHKQASQYKAKRDQAMRDRFLSALSHFDPQYWGKSAQRIAELYTGSFAKLPAQFHTKEFAAKLMETQPYALSRIPSAFVDQTVVNQAMVYGVWNQVLDDCDPRVITPEMVLEGVQYAINHPSGNFHHTLRHVLPLPKVYKTYRPMLDYLISTATLPMNDEDWPDDAWTPETVVKKIKVAVKGKRPEDYSAYTAYDYGYAARNRRYNNSGNSTKQSQQRWDNDFDAVWNTVPDIAKKPDIIEAIVKEFPLATTMIDKSLLTNSVLNIWMKATETNTRAAKDSFFAFPKSAWSNDTLATALKRKYIDEIPEEFKDKEDDETLAHQIASDTAYKTVDWSKITPEILVKAIGLSKNTSVITRVPQDSPLLDNEEIVFAILRSAFDSQGDIRSYNVSPIVKMWPPEKRSHWKQRDWDMAGGFVVPLDEIPPKFKNDNLTLKTILRDPENLKHIENRAKWLNENSEAIIATENFNVNYWLEEAIYFDGEQWFDDKRMKHTTGPNGGSYSYVETSTGAKIVYLYDKNGNLLEGLVANLKINDSYSKTTIHFTSKVNYHYGDMSNEKMKILAPYRDMIEEVLAKYPDIEKSMAGNRWGGSVLEPLGFYRTEDEGVIMREKLPRQKIEGSDLTYVVPNSREYGGTTHIIYDGSAIKAKIAAKIVIDTSNRGGNRFEDAVVYGTGADRIRWSEGFKNFMYGPADVASGSGPKFKESPLYRSCGVRGTGGFEWFTLFGEKILEHGGVSIWRQGRIVSIADDAIGLVATGKKTKDGSFAMTEKFADMDDKKLEKIFALMKGKL